MNSPQSLAQPTEATLGAAMKRKKTGWSSLGSCALVGSLWYSVTNSTR